MQFLIPIDRTLLAKCSGYLAIKLSSKMLLQKVCCFAIAAVKTHTLKLLQIIILIRIMLHCVTFSVSVQLVERQKDIWSVKCLAATVLQNSLLCDLV